MADDGEFEKQSPEIKRGGARPGAGRPAGVPNKMTRDLRAAILEAFQAAGGEAYLLKIAESDPRTFCSLLSKVLPTTITDATFNTIAQAGDSQFSAIVLGR
jgi:hypothetical protein